MNTTPVVENPDGSLVTLRQHTPSGVIVKPEDGEQMVYETRGRCGEMKTSNDQQQENPFDAMEETSKKNREMLEMEFQGVYKSYKEEYCKDKLVQDFGAITETDAGYRKRHDTYASYKTKATNGVDAQVQDVTNRADERVIQAAESYAGGPGALNATQAPASLGSSWLDRMNEMDRKLQGVVSKNDANMYSNDTLS